MRVGTGEDEWTPANDAKLLQMLHEQQQREVFANASAAKPAPQYWQRQTSSHAPASVSSRSNYRGRGTKGDVEFGRAHPSWCTIAEVSAVVSR